MAQGIQIISDFKDYYDSLNNNVDPLLTYRRMYTDSMPRGSALKFVRDLGIKTAEIGLPRQFIGMHERLVVYTDVKSHESKGKIVVDTRTALDIYSTNLASPYYENTLGVTSKFIQIGNRRFRVTTKNSGKELLEGDVTNIEELTSEFNYLFKKPIFSIDYIFDGQEMICIDYNEVQELGKLGFDKIIEKEVVIELIKTSLLKYKIDNI